MQAKEVFRILSLESEVKIITVTRKAKFKIKNLFEIRPKQFQVVHYNKNESVDYIYSEILPFIKYSHHFEKNTD